MIPKTALLSVSDKTNIIELAQALHAHHITILSTGGTAKKLDEAGIPHKEVSTVTGFPEIMAGRVKTLHPKIHGGILGKRDQHATEAEQHNIGWIDLIVCNLYPFAQVIQTNPDLDTAIENIDIGGPTMIRAAAKNFHWVSVVVDPNDYDQIINQLKAGIDEPLRKQLAIKAFAHTAQYDSLIQQYLSDDAFPSKLNLSYEKATSLRYGENPHQAASLYCTSNEKTGLLAAEQLQGKPMSYNNYADTDSALLCLGEFSTPACVVVKHANPCGVATADSIDKAFQQAFEADSKSAFGGIIAINQPCTATIAEYLSQVFFEIIVAPDYTTKALEWFSKKKNLRVLKLNNISSYQVNYDLKAIKGGLLLQEHDNYRLTPDDLNIVTKTAIGDSVKADLLFSWQVVKHIKSNAILVAKNQTTVGVGAGQVSRIDAVEIALQKAGKNLANTVFASDAFFPFRDSIDRIANTGIRAVIQPGGSVRDQEVIDACNEHGIAMAFTDHRCFNH